MKPILLQLKIAGRLLSGSQRSSAAGVIAAVAVVGVAIATAAMLCVLSVFNGFHNILTSNLSMLSPDIEVTPAHGKVFEKDIAMLHREIENVEGVNTVCDVLSDNALMLYNNRELPVKLYGTDMKRFRANTSLDSLVIAGNPPEKDSKEILLSVGAASQISFYSPGNSVLLFAPRREGSINIANPLSSFVTDSLKGVGVFESHQNEIDQNMVYCDISVAQKLFDRNGQSSAIMVFADSAANVEKMAKEISNRLGEDVTVRDRLQLADVNFRMVKIEKWVSFLMLAFILIIASFNIISTLCMIVIDKMSTIKSLHSAGMSNNNIGGIFFWESFYIAAIGGICGIILGIILCLAQQNFGFIRLNTDNADAEMLVSAYPVLLETTDIFICLIPIFVIAIFTGFIAKAFAIQRTRSI